MPLASAYTKTTAAWAVGSGNGSLDTGTVANNTWYYVFEILRPDTGVVDILTSLSATAPTMPTNYTAKRRIGAMRTNGSAQWVKFAQSGDDFLWDVPIGDVFAASLGTSVVAYTLSVPPIGGIFAIMNAALTAPGSGASGVVIFSPAVADQVALAPSGNGQLFANNAGGSNFAAIREMRTVSGQVKAVATAASTLFYIVTLGWVDRRGREG